MIKIKYIFSLLSISNMRYRIAFFLPWIGIFVGTIILLLVNGIMHGMEEEIFSSLNNLKKGYEIKSFSDEELEPILSYLDENGISYEIVKTRDIIISNDDDYMLVNMIMVENNNNLNNLNASIVSDNSLLNYWFDKVQDKVVVQKASLKKKQSNNKKSNWSYWSHGDLTIGSYHGKLGGPGLNLEKPKDIYTSGITFGADKKNSKNNIHYKLYILGRWSTLITQ